MRMQIPVHMCRGSELRLATGITGFLVKVNKGKWEVNKFLLETLFGPLRWVGADTSIPQHSDSNPAVWFLIWKREDLKSVKGSCLNWILQKNGKKKIWNDAGNSASWDTGKEI